jgi:arylsulfatase A
MGGYPQGSDPTGIEGGSIAALLSNEGRGAVKRPREELVFHFPHYQSGDGPHSALLRGDLKLLKFYEDDRLALFDLSQDLGERNDLSGSMPEKTAELHRRLDSYLTAIKAQMPMRNPRYDPNRPPPPRKERRGDKDRNRRPRGRNSRSTAESIRQ